MNNNINHDSRLVWKIRCIKPYPDARNHLLIGLVVGRDQVCLELMCKSFHFGRVVNSPKDIATGALAKRILPWNRIEIINELPTSFDYQSAKLHADQNGSIFFSDSHYPCPILTSRDKHCR